MLSEFRLHMFPVSEDRGYSSLVLMMRSGGRSSAWGRLHAKQKWLFKKLSSNQRHALLFILSSAAAFGSNFCVMRVEEMHSGLFHKPWFYVNVTFIFGFTRVLCLAPNPTLCWFIRWNGNWSPDGGNSILLRGWIALCWVIITYNWLCKTAEFS